MGTRRRVPTDYYRPIAKAVGRLKPNTLAARRSIYDQARRLLLEEAQGSDPPMGVSELIQEQRALEQAIQQVEEENILREHAAAVEDEVYFEPPPRSPAPRPLSHSRSVTEPPPARSEYAPPAPDPEYQEYEEAFDEPPAVPDPRARRAAEREHRMRQQEQRRLGMDERRVRRGPAPRASRGGNSRTIAVLAAVLVVLFLLGGGAAYVTVFGWPSFRAVQQPQPPQQPTKPDVPAPQAEDNSAKVRDLMDRASRSLESGDPVTAVQFLTEAIVLSPKDQSAYTLRGHSYLQAGEPARAIEDFSEAIRLGSRDFYAFVGRAVAYRRMRDFPRSIADYNEALRIRPDHAGAWNNRCFVQAIAGNLDAALADCNESLRLLPNEPNALDSRALVYLKQGKWDLAIADYDAVLKIAPNTVSALYGRGFAKVKKGDRRGQADISTATTAAPTIAQEFERYGVK